MFQLAEVESAADELALMSFGEWFEQEHARLVATVILVHR
jgi:hypothetical protein